MKKFRLANHLDSIKVILIMAIPLMIEQLVYQLQSLSDKAFLGNLETEFVSAVGAAQAPYNTTINFIFGISTGLVILVSQLCGGNERKKMQQYFQCCSFYFSIGSIVIFLLWLFAARPILHFLQVDDRIIGDSVTYIQICSGYLFLLGLDMSIQSMLMGLGRTKPIMYSAFIKVGMNIVLSWILIFGHLGFPKLYVAGAAIGTLIANVLASIFLFIYCLVKCKDEFMSWSGVTHFVKMKPFLEVIKLGIPAGLEFLLWHFSNLMLLRFVNEFSYMATGMYTLTYGLQCFACVFYQGTSTVALTLVGQSVGAGNKKKANAYFYTTILLNFAIVAVFAVLFCVIPNQLLDIFSNDNDLIHMGAAYLPLVAMTMFPQSVNLICGSAIRAHNDTKWMLYSQIIGSTLIISMSWFFIKIVHMNIVSVYLTVFVDETIRGIVNYIYYKKKYDM